MVKAHSLLYAVYVCLIVSIICGALLYFATLYNQLNSFYNTNEDLYIQNQSAVNYALGNSFQENSISDDVTPNIESQVKTKSYGLLNLLTVETHSKTDTITSTHFVGSYLKDDICLYLSSVSKPLEYSGKVTLIGTKKLPSDRIESVQTNNLSNELHSTGSISISDRILPDINSNYKKLFENNLHKFQNIKNLERRNDSVYFNSFLNETIEIELSSPILDNIIFKGNFILYHKDSIQVRNAAIMEDVILKAPSITFQEGFKGNAQAFATKKLSVHKSVQLNYPSVLCLYNPAPDVKSELIVDEGSTIYGAVVLFGNPITQIEENSITINKNTFVVGDIYCYGKLMLEGSVYGSVYTNRLFHKTKTATYENCIIDGEINVTKKPDYFVSIPIFEEKNTSYGVYKKTL